MVNRNKNRKKWEIESILEDYSNFLRVRKNSIFAIETKL